MKRFLKLTGIGIALTLALTGCSEKTESGADTESSSVVISDKTEQSTSSRAIVSQSEKTDERTEQGGISVAEPSSAITESTKEVSEYEEYIFNNDELPFETEEKMVLKDYIPDTAYDREEALITIVAESSTVEALEENIAEYNASNQNGETYNVIKVKVFDGGEEVSSGLLKDGMYVRMDSDSGGYMEYIVTRPPKDCIPDDAELPFMHANDISEETPTN